MSFQLKRRLVLVLAVAVLLLVCPTLPPTRAEGLQDKLATTQAPAEWTRYTVAGEEFSALLPVKPSMFSQSTYIRSLDKYREERVISAYSNGVVFGIHVFDNPARRQSLAEVIEEVQGKSAVAARDLSLGGFAGKEFSSQTPTGFGASQLYITDKHIYLFVARGSSFVDAEAAIRKFTSSVKLEQKPEGNNVMEGPGEPVTEPVDEQLLSGKEVTQKAIIVLKPEPRYTEAARLEQVTGTVVLRAVFNSSGAVTKIRALSGLPNGLTAKAIEAATRIKFVPAVKDGRFVSMWFQLEYNFNLY